MLLGLFIVCCSSSSRLSVDVDTDTALYTIYVDDTVWLHGGYSGLKQDTSWQTNREGTLYINSTSS